MDEIYALRPFRPFSGRYTHMMFGYRVPQRTLQDQVGSEGRRRQN